MKKIVLVGALCAFPLFSNAASITYQLQDVVFDDGATAAGLITFSQGRVASDISITTTAGQGRNYSVTYTNKNDPGVIGMNFGVSLSSLAGGDTSYWDISFEFNGPSVGAYYLTTKINEPNVYIYSAYSEYDSANLYRRYAVSGYIAPVPLPEASWFFGSALVWLASRKKQKNC